MACAGLLRRSEDRHLATTPLPIPVTSRFGAPGGMGWSVYDATGPAVTMKTWGQGPGGATAVYKDSTGRFRRLSPWEAMRTHSFPADFIAYLRDEVELDWESAYRLCGNSIPVAMLSDVVRHITTDVIKPQVVAAAAAANERRIAPSTSTTA